MIDSILNKKDSIERCILQIRKYYQHPSELKFSDDYLRQDAILLNLQRASQQFIDLANLTIRKKSLGLPKNSNDSFKLLFEASIIDQNTADNLQKMVGFRNVLVHQYQELDLGIVIDIVENHLDNLIDFAQIILLSFVDG